MKQGNSAEITRLKKFEVVGFAITVGSFLAFYFTICTFVRPNSFFSELAYSFRWEILTAGVIGLFSPLIKVHWVWIAIPVGVVATNAFAIRNAYSLSQATVVTLAGGPEKSERSNAGLVLKIAAMNVHGPWIDEHELNSYLDTLDADVIALEEYLTKFRAMPGLARFPYREELVNARNYGTAVYSKYPLRNQSEKLQQENGRNLHVSIQFLSQEIKFVAVHTPPPANQASVMARNREIEEISRLLQTEDGPTIVAGDFNTTPYSPAYQNFLRSNDQLQDTRGVFGFAPSWPSSVAAIGVPIDHIFVSRSFWIKSARVGPDFGSDHLPILAELELVTKD